MPYFAVIFLVTFFALSRWMNPLGALVVLLVLAGAVAFLIWRRRRDAKLKWYGEQYENIYVYSLHPDDDTLIERKREHEEWLQRASNKLGVQVRIIVFRDHLHPNESWEEEWPNRLALEIRADREERHLELHEQQGADWYLREVKCQKGIVYEHEQAKS